MAASQTGDDRKGLPPVTVTVMFTDIVASTDQLERLGGDAARVARASHDQILTDAIVASGGRVVKSLGDGLMATFEAARGAVEAAQALQQALAVHARRSPAQATQVRVGLSAGDVVWQEDESDCFGTAVVEAARLCARAEGGEVLLSELVRLLARDARLGFEPVGDLDLKGLSELVRTSRLLWAPAPIGPAPLPLGLAAARTHWTFVGRVELYQRLLDTWHEAQAGSCQVLLLAGEPGVGKSRLAAELAAAAHNEDALVLLGWCEDGVGAPYQPFVQALDFYTEHVRRPALGQLPGELRRLFPGLGERVEELPSATVSDARTEEYALLQAAASWLLAASAQSGLVLVLDDLHWADRPTLLLLGHLVRVAASDPEARLLIVATYRDSDVDRHHPLFALLGELARLPGVERLPMHGLTENEIFDLTESRAGHGIGAQGRQLAQLLYAETEGNPFFVVEVLRNLRETGALQESDGVWSSGEIGRLAVPVGVRDVVGRRLSRLSPTAGAALPAAAVIGRDFDLPLLAKVTELDEETLIDVLDEAVTARLVDEVGPELFRFAHALVRETLYDELSVTRRRRQHRRVVDSLEVIRPADVLSLAHHAELAGPDSGRVDRAVRYGLAAARAAQNSRAEADAELRYRRVLDLLEDDLDDPLAVDALIGIGECQRDRGDPHYRETLAEAARRAGSDPARLVAAVLANRRSVSNVVGVVDEERVGAVRRALELVGTGDTPQRAALLAQLAAELVFAGDSEQRLTLADEAELVARQVGDDRLLTEVLLRTSFPAISLDRVDALMVRGEEAVALADRLGDPVLRVEARCLWTWSLLTSGEVARAQAVTEEAAAVAAQWSPPVLRWISSYWLLAHVAAAGDIPAARALNDEMLALGETTGEPDRLNWWGAASTAIALLTAEVGALADLIGGFAEQYPVLPTWRAAHLQALCEAGRLDEARQALVDFPIDLDRLMGDPYALVGVASLADAAFILGDAGLASRLASAAEPHATRWAHLFIGIVGPTAWPLGLCEVTSGRVDQGVERLESALLDAELAGCALVAQRIRLDLLTALTRRDGDSERARTLARELEAVASVAPVLVERSRVLIVPPASVAVPEAPRSPAVSGRDGVE